MSTMAGIVAEFDAAVGLGAIVTVDGVRYPFHCIEIADGSRSIAVGATVSFQLIGKLGRFEAARIAPA